VVSNAKALVFREEDHSYWIGEPGVGQLCTSATQVITGVGLAETKYYTASSAEKGTFIHKATELHDLPDVDLDEDELDEEIMPYLNAYKQFSRDSAAKWEGIEKPLHDPQLLLAGTIDRVGFITLNKKKERVVLDIKSGSPRPWHCLQLACYQHLVTRDLLLSGVAKQSATSKPLVERYALYLRKSGRYKLVKFTEPKDIAVFMSAHTLLAWMNANSVKKG
jgi:hypothetical protein